MKRLLRRQLNSSTASVFAVCAMFVVLSGLSLASEENQHDKAKMARMATIKIEKAIKIATKKVPGTVTKAELETEHGPLMWEIEIVTTNGNSIEVHINAKDGKILGH